MKALISSGNLLPQFYQDEKGAKVDGSMASVVVSLMYDAGDHISKILAIKASGMRLILGLSKTKRPQAVKGSEVK